IRLSLLFLLFSASHDARHLLSFPTRRSSDLPDYGRWLWWVLEWVYGKVLPGAYAHEHITRYTRDELARRLRAAGYEILAWKYVGDRKSTRLNSSHVSISYAVFCLKKKKHNKL